LNLNVTMTQQERMDKILLIRLFMLESRDKIILKLLKQKKKKPSNHQTNCTPNFQDGEERTGVNPIRETLL